MKKSSKNSITNKVYEYRVLAKMTQKELADVVGVSKQTILIMEKGNYSPSLLLAFKIADYFDVPITDMFSYVKEEEN